jgi:hypothetical protein
MLTLKHDFIFPSLFWADEGARKEKSQMDLAILLPGMVQRVVSFGNPDETRAIGGGRLFAAEFPGQSR